MAPLGFRRRTRSLIFTAIFYLLVLLLAAAVIFLGATIISAQLSAITDAISGLSYQSFLACRVFSIPLFILALSGWSLFTALPILCFASRSGRLWYRRNVSRLFLWDVAGLKATLLGFGVCAVLGFVSADLAIIAASVTSLAYLCEGFRSRLALVLGYLLPSRASVMLVRKPQVMSFGGAAVLRTRVFLGWWTLGFVRVTGIPSTARTIEGLQGALFGAAEAGIPLGYALRYEGGFSVYFFTGVLTWLTEDPEEVLRRVQVLRQTVSACVPGSKAEVVTDQEELLGLVGLPERVKLAARGSVVRLANGADSSYFTAIRLVGLPAFKEERLSGLIETMLEQGVGAVYVTVINPVDGFVESFMARLRYRQTTRRLQAIGRMVSHSSPPQDEISFRNALNGSGPLRLFKVSTLIGLSCAEEERLRTAARAVKAAVQSEFCSEFSQVRARDLLGLDLFSGLNACRFSTPLGGMLIMAASDASRFIRLPSQNTPGLASTVPVNLALPQKAEQAVEEVEVGEILRNGKPLGQTAVLPIQSLSQHVAVFGTTGMGKTTFARGLLLRLIRDFEVNVLVFDPRNEYGELTSSVQGLRVLNPFTGDLSVNVLEVPEGVERDVHIEHVLEALHVLYGGWGPNLEELARSSLHALYEQNETPTISDWIPVARQIGSKGHARLKAALDSLSSRLEKMTLGTYERIFNTPQTTLSVGDLLESSTILDLHNMDADSQAFLVGALLTQLQDHVKTRTPTEKPFIVCIEEAHLFAPEIYEARSSREAIVQCPVARMLKEIRKFNVGVILIDQRPSQVTSDAIANCNTLIAFRMLEDHDKQKVIRSLGFNPGGGEGLRLSGYLSNLAVGEAIARTPISGMPFEIRTKMPVTAPENKIRLPDGRENAPEVPATDRSWDLARSLPAAAQRLVLTLRQRGAAAEALCGDRKAVESLKSSGLVKSVSVRGDRTLKLSRLGESVAAILLTRVKEGPP